MAVLSKFNKLNGTSLASFHKILFLFILASFLTFASVEAQVDEPIFLYHNCSTNRTTVNSAFQIDIKTLLSSLSSNAIGDTQFYRTTTVNGRNPSEPIYGLFMCRGDVSPQLCQSCVQNATQLLSTECSLSKQAVIWYDECMVRYSNRSFFSTVDTRPRLGLLNTANMSNHESFMRVLFATMNDTADIASHSLIGNKKYATKEANISEFQSLYCLAQCTDDLSPQNCRSCLSSAIGDLPWCCEGKQGGRVLYPSCNIRYELYPFFRNLSDITPPKFIPGTKSSLQDSESTEDPVYLHHNCSTKKTLTTDDIYLTTLLSYLSSNATNGSKLFHKAEITYMKYGLFMCRGDLPFRLCGQCVQNATNLILSNSECRGSQEGIIWYSHCLLRYSDQSFFSGVDKSPIFHILNITNTSNAIPEQNYFTYTLSNTLAKLANDTGDSTERYLTQSLKLNDLQVLYTLAQCTPDLSSEQCTGCLQDMIGTTIPWSRLGSVGGRVMYPSCHLRFELFQFYRNGDSKSQSPGQDSPPPPPEKSFGWRRKIILIIVPTIVSVILFSFGYYLLKRKTRKRKARSHQTILRQNFGQESATLEPLQFDLAVIKAATNNFSNENKIGRGGFGEVYKGYLLDGRQIAVKRLSRSSKHGANEFKNEVLLIAKLQHRNLVAFIGFCLEKEDKILIYEYVPNKSLDYILFDSQRQRLLSWSERYEIIGGIARGILYLHVHSRLKIIHRDLKPSNVLLDENMNPKISDFGLARIVEINQEQGSTNRIVGTYGYMSPEYAMFGQFSDKSDVYSFGVMVLEIITGKKNLSTHESHRVADGLLNFIWRQ